MLCLDPKFVTYQVVDTCDVTTPKLKWYGLGTGLMDRGPQWLQHLGHKPSIDN